LLFADSTGSGNITIKDLVISNEVTIANDLILGRHIVSSPKPTGLSGGVAACTAPSVTLTGNDIAGKISVTTGTGCGTLGKIATVDYNQNYSTIPKVTLTPANVNAAGLTTFVTSNFGIFDVEVASGTISDTTVYEWYYHVIQ
jgi:hypothetical protein